MTRRSSTNVYSGKIMHINLVIIFLMSISTYVFLYSNITKKINTTEKALHGIISRINRSWSSMEQDAQMGRKVHSSTDSALLLTLFTSWRTQAEKYICHNNTIRNWLQFKPSVKPVLFTNETLLKDEAVAKKWNTFPIRVSEKGVPVLKFMYKDIMERYRSHFYAYSNGDILYSNSLIDTLKAVLHFSYFPDNKPIMIVGRRTNVQNVSSEEAKSGTSVNKTANVRGKLFNVWGEDYFITSANYPWMTIPEVIIGRRAYDNWLVWNARKQNHTTIDATLTLLALHQTTKAGNNEGSKSNNPGYNHNLLSRMYNPLRYHAGITSCTEYITRYHGNRVEILKRNISKSCFPIR